MVKAEVATTDQMLERTERNLVHSDRTAAV
jgi:hypothetical protein